jgi:hypothetical protein
LQSLAIIPARQAGNPVNQDLAYLTLANCHCLLLCWAVKYNQAMAFDARAVEAKLALNLISSTDMPKLAWDALEAGLDGPAIRRIAAFVFPTFFQVQEVLPQAMEEMHLVKLDKPRAALQLAKLRAQEILTTNSDPLSHLCDFEHLWIGADYCRELQDCGSLDDEAFVARQMGQPEHEIREWVMARLKRLVSS